MEGHGQNSSQRDFKHSELKDLVEFLFEKVKHGSAYASSISRGFDRMRAIKNPDGTTFKTLGVEICAMLDMLGFNRVNRGRKGTRFFIDRGLLRGLYLKYGVV